ncbi:MAG: motility associated factor glycosyltransferase family protein, partial [Bacillota bacterium]
MLDLYKQNLKKLTIQQQDIIKQVECTRQFEIVNTPKNNLTIQIELKNGKKIYLHSKYRPKQEAQKYINSYDISNSEDIILIGFGLGYYAEEILSKLTNKQRLKIIISSPDIFKLALKNKDLKDILSDDRVDIILTTDSQKLVNEVQKLLVSKTKQKLIYKRQFIRAIPNKFQFFRDILEKIWIDQNNNKQQKKQIKKNINRNLEFALNSLGVKELRGLFSRHPIFVISAGPSLDKNIEQLKKVGDKGVIVAVDTAISSLLAENIEPDFIVTIESDINTYNKIFKKYSALKIPLVYSLGSHYKIVKNYSGPKIIALSEGDMSLNELDKKIDKGRLKTDGSVSSTAIDFAVKLGGGPIILVGQDLAFDGAKTHAENTFYKSGEKDDAF